MFVSLDSTSKPVWELPRMDSAVLASGRAYLMVSL